MAKFMLRTGEESTEPTVDSYVANLASRLERQIPEVDANEIVAETQAHLVDHVNSLVVEGATLAEAERAALAGFGSAQAFAGKIAVGTTETYAALVTRRYGRLAIAATFIGAIALSGVYQYFWWAGLFGLGVPVFPDNQAVTEPELAVLFLMAILTAVGIPICAFLACRPQTRDISIAAGVALAFILVPLVYVGPGSPDVVRVSRTGTVTSYKESRERIILGREEQINFLRREITHARDPQAFRKLSWKPGMWAPGAIRPGDSLATDRDFDSHTTHPAFPSDAIAAWTKNGPTWLSAAEKLHRAELAELATYPRWMDWNGLRSFPAWLWIIPFAAALVALDQVAAWAGRRVFLSRRRQRMRQAA